MTRRGYVAGALAALVLLVVPLGLVPFIVGLDHDREPTVSADEHYRIDGELTCDSEVREVPILPLEAEPVAMLVCADPDGSMPWTAPPELVEGDLSGVVDALAALEAAPSGDRACTMQAGPAYDLVLRFSRDRVAKVHGDTGSCGIVTVATGELIGAQAVLDAALETVEAARAQGEPPEAVEPLDLACDSVLREDGYAVSLTGSPTDFTRIFSCWQPNADELGALSQTEARPRDVGVITTDIARADPDGDAGDLRCPGGLDDLYFQTLVGQTVWGDLLVVPGECRRFYAGLPAGEPAPVWHPSPRAQRVLDRLRR